jgi:HAD superfamily hydrolase (TIGR01509 family)
VGHLIQRRKLHANDERRPAAVARQKADAYYGRKRKLGFGAERILAKECIYGVRLKLPDGTFKAYLFDCDGTIADSMPLHYVAWQKALGEWNCTFEEKRFYAWGGRPTEEIIVTLNQEQGLQMPVAAVAHRKEELYYELLPQLKAIPEVLEHIEAKHGEIPFAVVSGSTRDSVVASLNTLKLLDRFNTLVCAGEYTKSKPDPECFLVAASRLGVDPKTCVVFEDTDMGIAAARAAGMASVRVPLPWERAAAS